MGKLSTPESDVSKLPPNHTRCGVCRQPQYQSPSGVVCVNGHGGANELAPIGEYKLYEGGVENADAPIEPVWLEWKQRAARTLGALLADIINVEPSANEGMKDAVEAMIALEAELSR